MKLRYILVALFVLGITYFYGYEPETSSYEPEYLRNISGDFLIASWNVQTYGDTKASNTTLVADILEVISHFDVFILQELRDKDGSALFTLCSQLETYSCYNSSRAGRGTSKEQHAIFVKNSVLIGGFYDYAMDDSQYEYWERPPYYFWVAKNDVNVTLLTSHIRPSDAEAEINALERLVERDILQDLVIVIGDLNADCSYYNEDNRDFESWQWIIPNSADTTVSRTDCAYDRIIAKPDVQITQYGILKEGIYSRLSDHYPVWIDVGR